MARLIAESVSLDAPYDAYGGPETGGFGVLPQSAVPQMDPAELEFIRRIGTIDQSPGQVQVPTSVPVVPRENGSGTRMIASAVSPEGMEMMAPSTIAPKGGTPFRPSSVVDDALETYRRLRQGGGEPAYMPGGPWENAAVSWAKAHGNNLLAAPSALADIATYPQRSLTSVLSGGGLPKLSAFPKPTTTDIAAKLKAATSDVSEAEARANIEAADRRREEEFPISSTIGDIGGDVTTLATGRPIAFGSKAGGVGTPRAYEVLIKKKLQKAEQNYPLTSGAYRGPTQAKAAQKNAQTALKFMRGGRRVAEAGIEGAALALLHGQDPIEAAGFTAAAQGGLSAVTEAATRKWINFGGKYGKLSSLALQIGGLSYALHAMGKVVPGEFKDYEAQKAATDKLFYGVMIGAATGLFSARARSGWVSAKSPLLAEAFGSAPRNAMQSVILQQLREGDEAGRTQLADKLELILNNADSLSPEAVRDLNAALGSNAKRFLKEVDKLTEGLQ